MDQPVKPEDFPLVYTDSKEIEYILSTAREYYPSFVGDWLDAINHNFKSPTEAETFGYRGLFESLYRFVSWILLSIYLQEEYNGRGPYKSVRQIQNQFSLFSRPTFGVWEHTIENLLYFFNSPDNRSSFPIKELLFKSKDIVQEKNGYKLIYQDSVDHPQRYYDDNKRVYSDRKTSVLKAPVLLRNALYHDLIYSNDPFDAILPYTQDILCRLLEACSFLNNDPNRTNRSFLTADGKTLKNDLFELVAVDREASVLEILHGPVPKRRSVNLALLPAGSDVLLRRERANGKVTYIPMYPILLFDSTGTDKEYVLSKLSLNGRVPYLEYTRRPDKKKLEKGVSSPEFQLFRHRFDQRHRYLETLGIDPASFIAQCEIVSSETLQNSYLGRKFFPSTYLDRPFLVRHLNAFLTAQDKLSLLVSSEAGSGKSAWLSNIVYNQLKELEDKLPPINERTLPIFLNGNDFKLTGSLTYDRYFAKLIRERLSFSNPDETALQITSLPDLFQHIDLLMERYSGQMPKRILLVIDAINEADSPAQLLNFLNDLVINCTSDGKAKYPWLKILFTTRVLNFQLTNDETISYARYVPFYYNPTGIDNNHSTLVDVLNVIPTLRIPRFTPEEISAMFTLLVQQGNYPHLSQNASWSALLEKHRQLCETPLGLQLFADVMERRLRQQQPVDLFTTEDVLSIYYDDLIRKDYIKTFLDEFCRLMVERQSGTIPVFLINNVIEKINRSIDTSRQFGISNPLDMLLGQNVLLEKVQDIQEESGIQYRELVIQFVYQRFAEYALTRYLSSSYEKNWQGGLTQALNQSSNEEFVEYERALVLHAYRVWTNEKGNYLQLLELPVTTPHLTRYAKLVVGALFHEWEEDYNFFSDKVASWQTKVRLFTDQQIQLMPIVGFAKLFQQQGYELFYDRIGGRFLYDFCMEITARLFANEPFSAAKTMFGIAAVRRNQNLGNLLDAQTRLKEVEATLLAAIEEKEQLQMHLQNGLYGTDSYSELKAMMVDIWILQSELLRQRHYTEWAMATAEKASTLADELIALVDPGRPNSELVDYQRKKYLALSELGDSCFDQFANEKAEKAYQEAHQTLTQFSIQDPLDQAKVLHQLANVQQRKMEWDELRLRAAAMDAISDAFAKFPTSIKVKERYAYYAYYFSYCLIDYGYARDQLPYSIQLIEQISSADPTNREYRNMLGRAYMVKGRQNLLGYENVPETIKCYNKALEIHYALLAESPNDEETLFDALKSNLVLAGIYSDLGQNTDASTYFWVADSISARLVHTRSSTIGFQLAILSNNWANLVCYNGHFSRVRKDLSKSSSLLNKIKSNHKENILVNYNLAMQHTYVAWSYFLEFVDPLAFKLYLYEPLDHLPLIKKLTKKRQALLLATRKSLHLAIIEKKELIKTAPKLNYIKDGIVRDRLLNLLIFMYLNKVHLTQFEKRIIQILDKLKIHLIEQLERPYFMQYPTRNQLIESMRWMAQFYAYFSYNSDAFDCNERVFKFISNEQQSVVNYSPFYKYNHSLIARTWAYTSSRNGNQETTTLFLENSVAFLKQLCLEFNRSTKFRQQLSSSYNGVILSKSVLGDEESAQATAKAGADFFKNLPLSKKHQFKLPPNFFEPRLDKFLSIIRYPFDLYAEWSFIYMYKGQKNWLRILQFMGRYKLIKYYIKFIFR